MKTPKFYDEPGPRTQRVLLGWSFPIGALVAIAAAYVLFQLNAKGQLDPRNWSILLNADLAGLLLEGLINTLKVAAVSIALSIVFGVLLAVGRLSPNPWVTRFTAVWIEFFRGLPLLILIFFIYLGAPSVGLPVDTFWSLVIGITLYTSASLGDIIRAGVGALPKGQTEAAMAIGLPRTKILRLILVPQGVRIMSPSLISQLVILVKETSLGFIVGYTELLRNGRSAVEFLGSEYALPVYVAVAAIYLVINLTLSQIARYLDKEGSPVRKTVGKTKTLQPID